jgi:hypothetical protein
MAVGNERVVPRHGEGSISEAAAVWEMFAKYEGVLAAALHRIEAFRGIKIPAATPM